MIKRNKKGFTIVELVIVIAIVAILAAILIPTFSSVIDKANESADIQTVRQINVIIAAELIEKGDLTLEEVLDLLEDYNFTADNLKPVGDNHKFMWDKANKVVVLVKDDGATQTQIYPEVDGNNAVDEENVVKLEKPDPVEVLNTALSGGGTVTISENMALEEPITVPAEKNVTINLESGITLTAESINNNGILTISGGAISVETIENEGTLKLENTNISVSGGGIYNSNTFTLSGNSTLTVSIAEGYYDYGIFNTGELTLENESETNVTVTVTVAGDGVQGICNYGTINISNLTVSSTGDSAKGIDNYGGTLTVTGSEITVNGTSSIAVNSTSWSSEAPSIITLDNTKIYVSGTGSSGVYNNNSGELTTTIMNSDITVYGDQAYAVYNRNGKCTVDISNTDVTVTGSGAYGLHNGQNASTATIEGGTFKAEGTNSIHSLIFVQAGTVNISGTEITGSETGYKYEAPIALYETSSSEPKINLTGVTIDSSQHCLYSNGQNSKTTTDTEKDFTYGAGYKKFKCGYTPCSEGCVFEHYVVGG